MINFNFASLRLIGLTPAIAHQLHALADNWTEDTTLQVARIIEVHRDSLVLHNGSTKLQARALPRLLHELISSLSLQRMCNIE